MDVLMYLLSVPERAADWSGVQRRAFRELTRAIAACEHPLLHATIHADILPDVLRAAVYRGWSTVGSLKDVIHKVQDPREPYAHKYFAFARAGAEADGSSPVGAKARSATPLPVQDVVLYARQILDGVAFLLSFGFPCPHIHLGNIILSKQGHCQISDYELAVLLAPAYQASLAHPRLAPGASAFNIDPAVVGFGHCLFEMLTASELTPHELHQWERSGRFTPRNSGAPPQESSAQSKRLWQLLESIFFPSPGVSDGPTIESLRMDPVFGVAGLGYSTPVTPPPELDEDQKALLATARDYYTFTGIAPVPPPAADATLGLTLSTFKTLSNLATPHSTPNPSARNSFARSISQDTSEDRSPSLDTSGGASVTTAASTSNLGAMAEQHVATTAPVSALAATKFELVQAHTTEVRSETLLETESASAVTAVASGAAPTDDASSSTLMRLSRPTSSCSEASRGEPAPSAANTNEASWQRAPPLPPFKSMSACSRPRPRGLSSAPRLNASKSEDGSQFPRSHLGPVLVEAHLSPAQNPHAFQLVAQVHNSSSDLSLQLESFGATGDDLLKPDDELPSAPSSSLPRSNSVIDLDPPRVANARQTVSDIMPFKPPASSLSNAPSASKESPTALRTIQDGEHEAASPEPQRHSAVDESIGASASAPAHAEFEPKLLPPEAASGSDNAEEDAAHAEMVRAAAKLPNKNRPSDYAWLARLLRSIMTNSATSVTDLSCNTRLCPLFVVAGACPNSFCGMQAVMYASVSGSPQVDLDFWWVKPEAANPNALEQHTLNRHSKGPHKNDPGRSRALYVQFADLFTAADGGATVGGGMLKFGVMHVGVSPRAYIEQLATGERYYIYLIWQETWTSNPFARSKFILGKIVYQRDPRAKKLYARPYSYKDGVLTVPVNGPEEVVSSVLPSDRIKLGCS